MELHGLTFLEKSKRRTTEEKKKKKVYVSFPFGISLYCQTFFNNAGFRASWIHQFWKEHTGLNSLNGISKDWYCTVFMERQIATYYYSSTEHAVTAQNKKPTLQNKAPTFLLA